MASSSYDFCSSDADIILVSSEVESPTEFRVHRCILTVASSFFRDMFSLPQDPSMAADKVPVLPVSETARVLEALLRFIYPIADPILTSLEELNSVLKASIKYEFEAATSSLRTLLISPQFLKSSPMRVYAIACCYDLEEEAKVASRYTLGINLLDAPLSDDLKCITAYHYHQLLVLHKRRADAAISFFRQKEVVVGCMQCNGSSFNSQEPAKWWHEFEARAREELAVRPTTDVIFGLDFLYKAAAVSGCTRCPGSVMESWKFLMDLKDAIDALPATI